MVRKSVYDTFLDDIDFQKSRGYGIGTIREWRGKKYKKVAPGKWREVYTPKGSTEKKGPESVETGKKEESKPTKQLTPTYGLKQIAASKFKAADYKQSYDDESINADTPEGMKNAIKAIMELPIVKKHPEFEMKFRYDLERANKEPETVTKFRKSGEGVNAIYTPERQELHKKIIKKLLKKKLAFAKPKDGQQPTFQILGGRGGSGKSTFNKKKSDAGVYNEDNVIVVDQDALKEELANE